MTGVFDWCDRCVEVKQQHDMSEVMSPTDRHTVLVTGARLQDILTDSGQRMVLVCSLLCVQSNTATISVFSSL